jgi:SnoaL-like protein
MSESFPLPTEPEGVIPSLVERFNSGNVEAMMALYAPEAVFIANDGRTITDRTEIAARFQRDSSLRRQQGALDYQPVPGAVDAYDQLGHRS